LKDPIYIDSQTIMRCKVDRSKTHT